MTAVERAVGAIFRDRNVRSATVYISPTIRVTATRQHKQDRLDVRTTLIVTLGRPNYAQRKFIQECKKAKVTFPIRKAIVKFWPQDKCKAST